MKAELNFSVIVVSYRPGDWLAPCLESVVSQADDVVLVDNGSPGASASRIARAAGARVLRVPVNTGFAPAVNLGARASRGEFLALLNDDAVASPGWLPSAAQVLSDPSVAAVGPKLVLAARYREDPSPGRRLVCPGRHPPAGPSDPLRAGERDRVAGTGRRPRSLQGRARRRRRPMALDGRTATLVRAPPGGDRR